MKQMMIESRVQQDGYAGTVVDHAEPGLMGEPAVYVVFDKVAGEYIDQSPTWVLVQDLEESR